MNPPEPFALRAARWLAFGSAVSILFSIAVSQILLALALAALLASGAPLRLPRIKIPLALFLLGTVISLAFSGNATAGLPQIRKFYVFCELLVVFSAVRDMAMIRWLFLTWAGFGSITAIRGLIQFAGKVQQAHQLGISFYNYYVSERITGFMSHWNTFTGQEMFALIMLASFLFFAPGARKRTWIWLGCGVLLALAVFLGETRSVWIGTAIAMVYLVWFWQRKLVLLVPAAIALLIVVAPHDLRERFTSLLHPQQVDSNAFHVVTWRTGIRMIEAHPVLGLGPEMIKLHFNDWVPPDTPRPLPSGWYGHLHNLYLQYAAERGIPVLLVFLWMIGQMFYDYWRGLRALPPGRDDRRFLLHGGIAVTLAALAEGFFEVNLGDSEVLTMFLVVAACAYLALEKDVAGGACFNLPRSATQTPGTR